MDQAQFDRIARLLGGAASRRRGIGAAIAALAGMAGLSAGGADAARGAHTETAGDRETGRRRGPSSNASPCGDGSSKDNTCTKNSDCCTNICKGRGKGKKGRSTGRCRCQRKRRPCTQDRNCCSAGGQKMKCINRLCGLPAPDPVATGKACKPGKDTCADDDASCTEYQLGTPGGTYCLIPDGLACGANGDCESDKCVAGICVSNCTVCASGCPYTKIADAIAGIGAGSTIHIAPGIYDTYGVINDDPANNLTLRRCGARGEVRLTSTSDSYPIRVDGAYALTLENLTFFGINGEPGYNLLTVRGDISTPAAFANVTVRTCIFENMYDGDSYGTVQLDSYTNATFTGCIFRNNFGYEDGGAIQCSGRDDALESRNNLTLTNCTFLQNQNGDTPNDPDSYGGALYLYRANATITGCTFEGNYGAGGGAIASEGATTATIADTLITGNYSVKNAAPFYGGGILIVPSGETDEKAVIFNLTGTTKITRNSGSQGSGIAVWSDDPAKKWTVTGAPGRVFSNIGAPDQCAVSTDDATTWTGVPGCAF